MSTEPNSSILALAHPIASNGPCLTTYKVRFALALRISRRIIATYDRWYTEWNVIDLMSSGLNQRRIDALGLGLHVELLRLTWELLQFLTNECTNSFQKARP